MLPTLSEQTFAKITSKKELIRLSKVASMIDMEYDAAKFNHIKNNADAFLLMIQLNMNLFMGREEYCIVRVAAWGNFLVKQNFSEFNLDKQKAVRYAIVKDTAYIGYLIENK